MEQDPLYSTPYNVDLATLTDKAARTSYIERVLSLPPKIVDILFDPRVANWIEESLGPRLNFTSEQKRDLTRIIRDVALADLYFKKIPETMQRKLSINEAIAQDLTRELLETVFSFGWEDIQTMHRAKFGTSVSPSATNPHNVLDLRDKNKLPP